jgi:class 3 adenylate cyclase/integral membrane sensor domain MASE1
MPGAVKATKILSAYIRSHPLATSVLTYTFQVTLVAACYAVTARVGMLFALPPANVTAIWAPSGIAVACLLLWGYRIWPGIWLAAFVLDLCSLFAPDKALATMAISAGMATGGTLAPLLSVFCLRRFTDSSTIFARVQSVLAFVIFAGMLSCLVSSTLGATSLYLGGIIPAGDLLFNWLTWWMGDVAGVVIMTPLILTWRHWPQPSEHPGVTPALEYGLLLIALLLIAQSIFVEGYPLDYLFLTLLIWAVFRFGPHGAFTAIFVISLISIWATSRGLGTFHRDNASASLVLLQAYLGTVTTTTLILLAVITERARAQAEVMDYNRTLEEKVSQRTAALNAALSRSELQEQEVRSKKEQLEVLSSKLSKYLSPQVYRSIFVGQQDVKLESRRRDLTVFFSDIQGFTETTDTIEPEQLVGLLNNYLNDMAVIALRYGGTIDKFIGDAILIFFGDPETKGKQQDALACVCMALEMRERMKSLRLEWESKGISRPLHIRMGINTGYCTVGNFGSEDRLDYTIIGGQVNAASRLQTLSAADEILISHETYLLVKDEVACEPKGEVHVKGIAHPILTYQVLDRHANLGSHTEFRQELYGFSLSMNVGKLLDREAVVDVLHSALAKLTNTEVETDRHYLAAAAIATGTIGPATSGVSPSYQHAAGGSQASHSTSRVNTHDVF